MNESIKRLLDNNTDWVRSMTEKNPDYFSSRANSQSPEFLWVGCSDSRVPPNEVTNTKPGEIFVHRNIANLVVQTDMNILSVLQYAVEILKVKHVIVCGHYGCGGVRAAMGSKQLGLIDNWIRTITDTQNYYWKQLEKLEGAHRENRLVELNVIEQVYNLGKTSIVQGAWEKGQPLYLHGWVYDLETGFIKPQASMISNETDLKTVCKFEQGNNRH